MCHNGLTWLTLWSLHLRCLLWIVEGWIGVVGVVLLRERGLLLVLKRNKIRARSSVVRLMLLGAR